MNLKRLLILSGLIGFTLSAYFFTHWQAAVEGSQILAGTVPYLPENLVFLQYKSSFTLIHFLGAGLLKAGMTPWQLSVFFTGLVGALSFQACALITYLLSRQFYFSFIPPLILLFWQGFLWGLTYPMSFAGTPETYGALGQSFVLLSIALCATPYLRLSGLMLGLGLSVHGVWGGWALLIYFLSLVGLSWRDAVKDVKSRGPWILLAILTLFITYPIHRAHALIPSFNWNQKMEIFHLYVRDWDGHRQIFPLSARPLRKFWLAFLIVGCIQFLPSRLGLATEARRLIQLFLTGLVTAALSFIAFNYYHPYFYLVEGKISWPEFVWVAAIPGRFVNFGIFIFIPLTLGLAGHRYSQVNSRLNWRPIVHSLMVLALAGVITLLYSRYEAPQSEWGTEPHPFALAQGYTSTLAVPAGFNLLQAISGRSILLSSSSIDFIPTQPALALLMEPMLRDVYNVSLRSNISHNHSGNVPIILTQRAWEARTRDQWVTLGKKYSFGQIMTENSWRIDLPKIRTNHLYSLYSVE